MPRHSSLVEVNMRLLFTFIGGNGHFQPLVPLAQAAQAAGHTVAFGCSPTMSGMVEREGFTAFILGSGTDEPPERLPLRPLDQAREDAEFRDLFAQEAARSRVPLIQDLCERWQPDIVLCDEADFGAMLAAEKQGLPYGTMMVMAEGSFVRRELISGVLNEVRSAYDLPPDPQLAMLSRYLVLSSFPPSFRNPAYPLPSTVQFFRPPLPQLTDGLRPPWTQAIPGGPAAYFTLGTVFNTESGDLFARVLTGLRELTLNVLVTVGRHIDPAEFGPQPEHIQIKRYVPQAEVLPFCDLVIAHGGSGSLLGTLSHGLPMLLLPMGADQLLNAQRCAQLGLGQWLDPLMATPTQVRESVNMLLTTPAYREAAGRMRDEIRALPDVTLAIQQIERVARR
jgi:UDP:flavonoid glycosyltransferase YjiC (YdhE family)